MAGTVYYVVSRQGQWMIKLRQKDFGPYKNQKSAIRAAIDAAQGTGNLLGAAEVLVQEGNAFRTEWIYGHDPYPPRG